MDFQNEEANVAFDFSDISKGMIIYVDIASNFKGMKSKRIPALIDTGSNACCLSETLVEELGLKKSERNCYLHSAGNNKTEAKEYFADIFIFESCWVNKVPFLSVKETESDYIKHKAIIGLNFLKHFDFAFTKLDNGKYRFLIRKPHSDSIDFLKIKDSSIYDQETTSHN